MSPLAASMVALNAFCSGQVMSVLFRTSRLFLSVLGLETAPTYTADDLVEMRRWVKAWGNKRIQPLDDQLRAIEPEQRGRGPDERKR
jgi:hypothetical protein